MKSSNEPVVDTRQQQLEQLRDRFEVWRSGRVGRAHLPGELWSEAANVARQCGVYRTAKVLRLSYHSLKQHVQGDGLRRGKLGRAPKFVELRPLSPGAMAECSVELENVRGGKIKIQLSGGAVGELSNLARLFWREL
jgi:hypothetical protein